MRFVAARAGYSCGLAVLLLLFGSRALQNAVAEGDTRTISLHHIHTDEDITITFKRDGRYDEAALEKLDWFLRDWRQRRSDQNGPAPDRSGVGGAARGRQQGADLGRVRLSFAADQRHAAPPQSSGVARFSQHMLGRAMDFYIPGVPLEEVRAMGLRLARGGVGFYPTSGSPFVHMDTGSVRMWPRMSREQLVRVFPDGKTVQIPTDGRPLPGYALALAEIRQRGNNPSDNSVDAARNSGVDVGTMVASEDHHSINPFAKLFGLRKGEEDDDADSAAPAAAPAPAATTRTKAKAVAVAAVERVKAAVTHVAAQTKLIHTNAFAAAAATPAAQKVAPPPQTDDRFASLTPNQVISRARLLAEPA